MGKIQAVLKSGFSESRTSFRNATSWREVRLTKLSRTSGNSLRATRPLTGNALEFVSDFVLEIWSFTQCDLLCCATIRR